MNVMTRNENPDVLQAIYRDIDLTLLGSCPLENGDAVGVPEKIVISSATSHRDKDWKTEELTFSQFLERAVQHDIGKKEGTAWSPFDFDGGRRSTEASRFSNLLVFDCDAGTPIEEIRARLYGLGYACLVISTYNHGKTATSVKRKRLEHWSERNPEASIADFLIHKGYIESVAYAATGMERNDLACLLAETGETVSIRHGACQRFRLVLFLEKPWCRADYRDRKSAVEAYKTAYKNVARELAIPIDDSACDVARLFFDARHDEGAPYVAEFMAGRAVDPWPDKPEEYEDLVCAAAETASFRSEDLTDPELERLVGFIANDHRFDDRNAWCGIGAAIRNASGASETGRRLFHTFSKSWSGGYDEGETERVWDSLVTRPNGRSAGIGTLVHYARQDGWTPSPTAEEEYAPHGDVWNGRKFAERHRSKVLFVSATGQWLSFNGVIWSVCQVTEIERMAKNLSRDVLASTTSSANGQNPLGATDYQKAANVHASLPRIRRIYESAKSEPDMAVADPSVFDADPFLFAVANGVVDLRTGDLREARPKDFLSKMGTVRFERGAEAPKFLSFLEKIMPDEEVRRFVQRAVGYMLTGSVVEEKVFFFWGNGANGKSVFGNVLASLMGDYAVSLGSSLVAKSKHDNEAERLKARLPGARLAQINELGQGDIWDDQRLKELASRERVSARYLHHEAFEFFPTHKLLIRGNYLPGAHDAGDGFWRRLVPIEFGVQIPEAERVPDLDSQIIGEELPGVLNWAIDGCIAWQCRGLKIPASIKAFGNQYRNETDVIGQWEAQHCKRVASSVTGVGDLYASYRLFCMEDGLSPMSKNQFSRLLTQRGLKRAPGTSVRRIVGIELLEGVDDFFE
ncbi:phage/plasmid primase, P4 family [Ruegeria arenilitoris]|uniref:phage/plasmid primase, P4 family n=1 Tax=Ruegeria arenilitoris TaxID=1173585 RepID=UPI00147CB997|nr:phage/plasmid primase, P4 family [Ruegeria arenilitoris]